MANKFTTLEKAKILCRIAMQAEEDDPDIYSMLWHGLPGYVPPSERDTMAYAVWKNNIDNEWDEAMDMLGFADNCDKSNEELVDLLNQ